MPNIAAVIKEEIARISRKEAKAAVAPLRKPSVRYRGDIADLKSRLALMEKANKDLLARLAKVEGSQPAPEATEEGGRVRITAKGMKSLRKKLGLSAGDFGRLLGITAQGVYNNEHSKGALRLRATTKTAYLAVRGMGAKEAKAKLAESVKKPVKKAKRAKK